MDLASVKRSFFDKAAVASKIDPAVKKALSRFGAMARQDIRKVLKYGTKASRPGQPPTVHRSRGFTRKGKGGTTQGASPLRELVFYGFDQGRKSVVIGPALGGDKDGAPATLEEGGPALIDTGEGRKVVRIAPRPYVGPTFTKLRGKAAELFEGTIR